MDLYFITKPLKTRAGKFAVAYGKIPLFTEDLFNELGNIKHEHITEIKYYKLERNAIKFVKRTVNEHWLELELVNQNRLN